MGLPFAEHLAEFAKTKGIATGTIAKIAQNPDQSKHLETATLKLYGLDIDLVNLRSEEYAENSRIPTGVSFGTPLEDAKRRDITINALFYNVHTHSVEDFTEKGLDDLRDGLIRTPLPPKETFKDDPLRVLRCVRFASRFGFDLVDEISSAAKDPVIQDALVTKVTRERVGVELSKMLKGRDPLRSIELIHQLSLFTPIVSALPSEILATLSNRPKDPELARRNATVLSLLLDPIDDQIPPLHPIYYRYLRADATTRARLYLASFLTPYLSLTYLDKKRKALPAVEAVIREALKLGTQNHFLDGVPFLFSAVPKVRQFLLEYPTFYTEHKRSRIGMFLRHKNIHHLNAGVHWSSSFLFSLVTEMGELYDLNADKLDVDRASALVERYNQFATLVEELELYDAGEMRPLLDGREVSTALGAKKGGPWLAEALSKVVEWQLDNPQQNKEQCTAWLKREREEGRIQIDELVEPTSKRPRKK
ncbi:transfer RNA nucleotidyltransferase [Coprinopsis cinerea okayama7|uniref:Transfer RNA nucleotidyltransferase n=1 Tax=Coprinopsis cinerea (strain Okayama-7 / 130 / ATCC MYA-4618 / FGSC 9003) TaxID=240176 RepID=A8N269_COPC7|nr:transfer RNA nucleotidyltransferase [Coprinopsis cinerea okayama7\|eukprot:XP_001828982.2 transfer RNA nucleotidyltransferase [Coprinopsis cinerea okayama7\